MHAITNNWRFCGFDFWAEVDTGAATGANELTLWYAPSRSKKQRAEPVEEAELGRTFYSDEANEWHMRRFCYKFATDEKYRAACINGTTPWALRDALFERNMRPHVRSNSWLSPDESEVLFKFLSKHAAAIFARPDYKALVAADGLPYDDSYVGVSAEFMPVLDALGAIPHTVHRGSDQGVSGRILHEGELLLAVTRYEPEAYVDLETPPAYVPVFESVSEQFPNILVERKGGLCVLANGDNVAFRTDVVAFAAAVKREIDGSGKILKSST